MGKLLYPTLMGLEINGKARSFSYLGFILWLGGDVENDD